jgi:hypothetical protein
MLPAVPGETGDSNALPKLKNTVDQVYSANAWAIFAFHFQSTNSTNNISSADFRSFLDYIQSKGVSTITVNQGLNLSNQPTLTPDPTSSPSPTFEPTTSPTPILSSSSSASPLQTY